MIEVSFNVEADALKKLRPQMGDAETEFLKAFDGGGVGPWRPLAWCSDPALPGLLQDWLGLDAVHPDQGPTLVKKAAAQANEFLGIQPADISVEIQRAADSIIRGERLDEFPITPWQTGSGTQTNMNINKVIANIANCNLDFSLRGKHPVHPNDHVNLSQSSNDSFPTAMHLSDAQETVAWLCRASQHWRANCASRRDASRTSQRWAGPTCRTQPH